MNIDIGPLARWAESQGWTIVVDSQGDTHFYDQEGTCIARYPDAPTNPRLRLTDVLSALKRAGLPTPRRHRSQRRDARPTG